jgi:hypothetical protein
VKRLGLGAVVLGMACGFLDDRPSQRAADRAHSSLRPGMTLGEVVALTEPLVDRSVWALHVEGCAPPGQAFTVRRSPDEDGAYLLEADDLGDRAPAVRALRTRDQLIRALGEEPKLLACREFEVGLGQWSVPFHVDAAGRVDAVSRPRFTD